MISSLDFLRYRPRTYIISEGDLLSAQKARILETERDVSPFFRRNPDILSLLFFSHFLPITLS